MREPGDLEELGAPGREAWSERVGESLDAIATKKPLSPNVAGIPDETTTEVTGPDWIGFPARVATCLTRREAMDVIDWCPDTGDGAGPRPLQDEYLEWRAVKDGRGSLRRVEMTTELADYWRVLAAHQPQRTRELVAQFAGEADVPFEQLYGRCDPCAAGVGPEDRGPAFEETMLSRTDPSPYNDGRRAICCMLQITNGLDDLIRLAARSAVPLLVTDPDSGLRYPTAPEAIALLDLPATAGRNSDPVLVERLMRLALEGRRIAFDDPLGVYIQGVEHARLRRRNGSEVPGTWFRLERGVSAAESWDGRSRCQRLIFEIPSEEQVVDTTTEELITTGAQVADLVQLAIFVRISNPDTVTEPPREQSAPAVPARVQCEDVCRVYQAFRSATGDGAT